MKVEKIDVLPELKLIRHRCVQGIGAGISLQSRYNIEQSYNELRDRVDRLIMSMEHNP